MVVRFDVAAPYAVDEEDVRQIVRQHLERLLGDLAGLGLSPREVVRRVEQALKDMLKSQEG